METMGRRVIIATEAGGRGWVGQISVNDVVTPGHFRSEGGELGIASILESAITCNPSMKEITTYHSGFFYYLSLFSNIPQGINTVSFNSSCPFSQDSSTMVINQFKLPSHLTVISASLPQHRVVVADCLLTSIVRASAVKAELKDKIPSWLTL